MCSCFTAEALVYLEIQIASTFIMFISDGRKALAMTALLFISRLPISHSSKGVRRR
jgi:hypothetical protein